MGCTVAFEVLCGEPYLYNLGRELGDQSHAFEKMLQSSLCSEIVLVG